MNDGVSRRIRMTAIGAAALLAALAGYNPALHVFAMAIGG
jgi:hypothetical protein